MKKVVILEKGKTDLVEVPDPRPKDDWVVVRVDMIPMCTEYKAFAGGGRHEYLGHEAAGEVVEVAQPGRVRVGDRVVVMPLYPCGKCPLCLAGDYIHCRHGVDAAQFTGSPEGTATYAEYLVKPDWLLVPLPEGMSIEHGGMACCGLGPTFGACERMGVGAFDTVLIAGLGPVGLGGVINACYRGARVIGTDPNPYRTELARQLGAVKALNPYHADAAQEILDFTEGVGVDKAMDCSGTPDGQRFCIDSLRRRGQMAFIGESGDLTVAVSNDLLRKGLTVHGVWHYNLALTPAILKVIRASGDAFRRFITHEFPMSRVQQAFELQVTGQCGKVILRPRL